MCVRERERENKSVCVCVYMSVSDHLKKGSNTNMFLQ